MASTGEPSSAWTGTCPGTSAIRPWTLLEGKRDSLHGFERSRLRGASATFLDVCTGKHGDQVGNSWTQVSHSMNCLLWIPKDC